MIDYNEIDFPPRLNSYRLNEGERECFRIFINEEYDKATALIKAVESVKDIDSEEANKLRQEYYDFFIQYKIDIRKTVHFSYSTCIKLLVVSTGNKFPSRERMICQDIEDAALGYSCYNFDYDYHQCMFNVYDKLGFDNKPEDIEILPTNSIYRRNIDVEKVISFRKSQS